MKYVIGIDLGTSATKTILVDEDGCIRSCASAAYPMYQPGNGWAEQDPLDWRSAALKTVKEVVKGSGVDPARVAAIGLSGQMHGLVMLDENNELLRRSIIWCDQRATAQVDRMLSLMPEKKWMEITANPPIAGWTAAKILWVREHEKELFERCRHILLPKDYVRFVLTGKYAADVSDGSGMQLMDVKNRCWSDEVLRTLGISRALLGELHESVDVIGNLLPEAAKACGLTTDTVVVAGGSDNACAALGTGIVREGQAFTSIGTSAIVYTHLDTYRSIPGGGLHLCCCAVPGCWHTMGGPQSAGLSLEWFREKFCRDLAGKAAERNVGFFEFVTDLVKDIPAGSERLIFLPFLMGERTPHLNAWYRGGLVGLNVIHSQAHVLRAMMEGVAFCLEDCNAMLRDLGVQVTMMRACGGGSRSPVWRQILSDVFSVDIHTLLQEEGPAFGAAILAGVGAGIYPSVEEACDSFIRENAVTRTDAQAAPVYRKYHEIYDHVYEGLKASLYELYHVTIPQG